MRSRLTPLLLLLVIIQACLVGLLVGVLLVSRVPTIQRWVATPPPISTISVEALPTPIPPAPAPLLPSPQNTEQRLISLYRLSSPAVVNITTQVLRRDFFWGVIPESGSGSGFLWDEQGHIVTNYHVIEGAQSIEVSFSDDLVFTAELVGVDPPNDLAVLKLEDPPREVQPLNLGDSQQLRVGQTAVAIGNPFGQFQRTLTAGIISALDRTIQLDEARVLRGVIQTDAAINRGNSGGPLLDSEGKVIGITTAIFSPSGTSAGVGLAIPINKVKQIVPVLIVEGRYLHPWLGIEELGYAITPQLAELLDLPLDSGLLVARLYRNSPAQRAGLRGADREVIAGNRRLLVGGDILIAIDDQPLRTWEDLEAYLQERTRVGQQVTLEVLREGERLQIQVEVGAEPQ